MIICNYNKTLPENVDKVGKIILTKLNYYIPFLEQKKLALIKIDVEGAEGKVFEGGIKLITHYHVPFIFMEFIPSLLRIHDTNPKEFLQMFINNGYKISPFNFLEERNYSLEYILIIIKIYIIGK